MPTNPRHFLEERPAFLGSQRQRLVDHALADEQEGVVGQVSGIEQIDEVLESHPLFVEEVVVLARTEESAPQFDGFEVDRKQPVGVAEDQRHVRHPESGTLVGPGEDDVFGLAKPQRATLLAESPAQRVGQVALARPVRAHDGADSRTELHESPFAEGLEALQPESQ